MPLPERFYLNKMLQKERPIASVTKIMTLLLIFQALHNQTIQLEDLIPVSAHAASMGGSQVYLEEGETQTVETLIKCIVVASANDACVAMAEQLAGSEEAFVRQMNETALHLACYIHTLPTAVDWTRKGTTPRLMILH